MKWLFCNYHIVQSELLLILSPIRPIKKYSKYILVEVKSFQFKKMGLKLSSEKVTVIFVKWKHDAKDLTNILAK